MQGPVSPQGAGQGAGAASPAHRTCEAPHVRSQGSSAAPLETCGVNIGLNLMQRLTESLQEFKREKSRLPQPCWRTSKAAYHNIRRAPDVGRARWATVGLLPEPLAGQGSAVGAVAGSQLLSQVGNEPILAVVLFFTYL